MRERINPFAEFSAENIAMGNTPARQQAMGFSQSLQEPLGIQNISGDDFDLNAPGMLDGVFNFNGVQQQTQQPMMQQFAQQGQELLSPNQFYQQQNFNVQPQKIATPQDNKNYVDPSTVDYSVGFSKFEELQSELDRREMIDEEVGAAFFSGFAEGTCVIPYDELVPDQNVPVVFGAFPQAIQRGSTEFVPSALSNKIEVKEEGNNNSAFGGLLTFSKEKTKQAQQTVHQQEQIKTFAQTGQQQHVNNYNFAEIESKIEALLLENEQLKAENTGLKAKLYELVSMSSNISIPKKVEKQPEPKKYKNLGELLKKK